MAFRVVALLALALAGCGVEAPPPRHFEAGRLGRVELLRPIGASQALVVLFSDEGGWSPEWQRTAERLRATGVAVVGVDLPIYLDGLRASDDGCHYLISEIEELSKRVQRDLGSDEYRSPILAGVAEGGTLAYAALAQAPAATVAGAVVVDPAPALRTRVPLCPGTSARALPAGGFAYDGTTELPGFLRVSSQAPLSPGLATVATGGVAPAGPGTPSERLAALVAVASAAGRDGGGSLADLPVVVLPAARPGPWMAVIYSGDGGWRDLDKTIGELLARQGVPVVGVDSLRYFWSEKPPERVAADLARILQHYGETWNTSKVALIGYSFGAGIVPFAVNRLPDPERARVVQITLLGLGPRAPFEFKVSGWLGQVGVEVDPYEHAPLVLPELLRIDPRLVQCVYGEDEKETLCTAPELAEVERIGTAGSHHFGGDYAALAQRILDGLRRRAPAERTP
jgi:type IV secretory pathway VirJ component